MSKGRISWKRNLAEVVPVPTAQRTKHYMTNQTTNEQTNQPADYKANQITNQPTNKPTDDTTNQTTKPAQWSTGRVSVLRLPGTQ